MKVVVCGGGAVGAACAYFLSRRGADVVVVERTGLACAASGKSGGFLALNWCDGSPLEALARRSFALHGALAGELAGDSAYRRMTTYSGCRESAGTVPGSCHGCRTPSRCTAGSARPRRRHRWTPLASPKP